VDFSPYAIELTATATIDFTVVENETIDGIEVH
jgi:hypothetical protein